MSLNRNDQEGSKNYQRFLKFYRLVSRYRDRGFYQWIHNNQKTALILIILLGIAIFLYLMGYILTGIEMVQ